MAPLGITLLLLVLVGMPACVRLTQAATLNEDQAAVLSVLADSWGPFDGSDTWQQDPVANCKEYVGIKCDSKGRITNLTLTAAGLQGSVEDVVNLTSLVYLDLSENSMEGTLDPLTVLTALKHLNLGGNQLTGELPVGMSRLSKLTALKIYATGESGITGEIPEKFSKLVNLVDLRLSANGLQGPIPIFFSRLTKLTYLTLRSNTIGGRIPKSISMLKNLKVLGLGETGIEGYLTALVSLTKLEGLYLPSNTLNGTIPDAFSKMKKLQNLDLSENYLSGPLFSIAGISKLIDFNVRDNMLTGVLPSRVPTDLEAFDVTNNYFFGKLKMSKKNGDEFCPTVDGNCLEFAEDSTCTAAEQKDEETCNNFCGTNTEAGQCEGRGVCVTKSIEFGEGDPVYILKCVRK